MKKKIFIASAMALTMAGLSACSSDESAIDAQQGGTPLQISTPADDATRTTSTDGYNYDWEMNTDYIGVTGNLSRAGNKPNVKYAPTTNKGNFLYFTAVTAGNDIVADAADVQTYTAYYPWGGTEGTENSTAVHVGLDNTTDYLHASQSTTYNYKDWVSFTFYHQLAKFAIKITSDGTTAIDGATWKITNGLKGGSIVPSTGVVTLDATTTDMTTGIANGTPLLIPAQSISSGSIVITAGGVTYTGVISSSAPITLSANTYKVLTVTVSGNKLAFNGSDEVAWSSSLGDKYTEEYVFKDANGNREGADFTPSGTINGHDYVQLVKDGLKWATKNMGASKIEEPGDYYEWGATSVYPTLQGYVYSVYNETWKTTRYYTYKDETTWSETSTWGWMSGENNITAYSSNDVAYLKWGGTNSTTDRWTIPDEKAVTDILYYTTDGHYSCTLGTLNGVSGFKVTSNDKKNTTGKSLFFPYTGFWSSGVYNASSYDTYTVGWYITATYSPKGKYDNYSSFYTVQFDKRDGMHYTTAWRSMGSTIRPVCK